MKKLLKVVFVAILAIAVAAPAMADVKLNGYFRTQMQADNVDGKGAKDAPTEAAVDQRIRMKVTNQLTDEVKVVYYGEVDTVWGKTSKGSASTTINEADFATPVDLNGDGDTTDDIAIGGAAGGGGKAGADGVNIETKNAYVAFNVPNSILSASVGIQGFGLGFDYVLVAQDMAGVKLNLAVSDTFSLGLQYAKLDEGSFSASDDNDYYAAQGKFKLGGGSKLALSAVFQNDNASSNEGVGLGAEYNGKFGGMGLNAWAFYTDVEDEATSTNTTGYAASVQAVFGKSAARLTYFSGDDGSVGDSDAVSYDIGGGAFGFAKENLQIMFYDYYYNNLGSTGKAIGHDEGLLAVTFKHDMMMGDMYLKLGAGYFLLAEDRGTEDELGMEISARLGQKVAEKVDVSLNAAYAAVGDAIATDSDDMYKVNFMINVGF